MMKKSHAEHAKHNDAEPAELDETLSEEPAGAGETDSPEARVDEAGDVAESAADSSSEPEIPIQSEAQALQKERDNWADQLLRARAEFDNYRKRMARETERIRQVAAKGLIRDILPVVDHLELAMKHADDHPGALAEGVAMVLRQFQEALGKHGLQPIPAVGEPFDPNVHEAVMQRESKDAPPESVLEEFQKGYRLGQMVLRPAKVVVSVGAAASSVSADVAAPLTDENGDNDPA
jgi:molecular chaperone GrpE